MCLQHYLHQNVCVGICGVALGATNVAAQLNTIFMGYNCSVESYSEL